MAARNPPRSQPRTRNLTRTARRHARLRRNQAITAEHPGPVRAVRTYGARARRSGYGQPVPQAGHQCLVTQLVTQRRKAMTLAVLSWPLNWVGVRGLEPRTSSLSGKRSNRLSYTPRGASRGALGPQPRLGYFTASGPPLARGDKGRRGYSVSRRVTSTPPIVVAIRL
jgi:hypothetical protein